MTADKRKFYHYACHHSVEDILACRGTLVPNPYAGFQPKVMAEARRLGLDNVAVYVFPVVWVTDVDVCSLEDAVKIGLSQSPLSHCNRTEFRFLVPNVGLVPWERWADQNLAPEQAEFRSLLEDREGGAEPDRWWVSSKPVAGCRLDEGYGR
jgi:hypothetical protein